LFLIWFAASMRGERECSSVRVCCVVCVYCIFASDLVGLYFVDICGAVGLICVSLCVVWVFHACVVPPILLKKHRICPLLPAHCLIHLSSHCLGSSAVSMR
jgi:hypothetical protein